METSSSATNTEIGFGKSKQRGIRVIQKDGTPNVIRSGKKAVHIYQELLRISWIKFILLILFVFVGINLCFAGLFYLAGESQIFIQESMIQEHRLLALFFFSCQTFTTVGYGMMHPTGIIGQILSSFCALSGLLTFAVISGICYARFSKPKSFIIFSEHAVITAFDKERKALMIRCANATNNPLTDMHAEMNAIWIHGTTRKGAQLKLELNHLPLFPLNWTLVHIIDMESPFWQMTETECLKDDIEVIVYLKGYDEASSQMITTRTSYTSQEFLFNRKFIPMYEINELKPTILHLSKISDTVPEEA